MASAHLFLLLSLLIGLIALLREDPKGISRKLGLVHPFGRHLEIEELKKRKRIILPKVDIFVFIYFIFVVFLFCRGIYLISSLDVPFIELDLKRG